jgi:hypothetical protein
MEMAKPHRIAGRERSRFAVAQDEDNADRRPFVF